MYTREAVIMKNKWLLPAILGFILILLVGNYFLSKQVNVQVTKQNTVPTSAATALSLLPSTTIPPVTLIEIQKNIQLISPKPDEAITLPITIKGKARVSNNFTQLLLILERFPFS